MAGCSRTLCDSEIDLVISSDCDDSSECSDVPELCEVVGGIENVVRSDHSGRGSDGEPDNDLHQSLLVDSGIISRIISEVFVVGNGFGGCLGTICLGPRRVDDIVA
ncbi:hypothetical protein J6590_093664 [Homalodisca vitripennis]|nr:hypothetical protein J6590_093664 [Homalodisca vitripennis]